nr:MAG TPA: hypothetical protein [Caudoviricetes sp.]
MLSAPLTVILYRDWMQYRKLSQRHLFSLLVFPDTTIYAIEGRFI